MRSEGQRKGWWLVRLIRSIIEIKDRTYSGTFALVSINMWLYSGNLTHHSTSQNCLLCPLGKHPLSFSWLTKGRLLVVSHNLAPASFSTLSLAACPSWCLCCRPTGPFPVLQMYQTHQLLPQPPAFLPPTFHWPALFTLNLSAIRSLP